MAWARSVKRRRGGKLPPLWFFTDPQRVADPLAAVRGLAPGLCGVVFRDRDAALARQIARVCRARRLVMVVAGNANLAEALGVGVHLRRGQGVPRNRVINTGSAHSAVELVQARRAGAALVFLSPVFATASHQGQSGLGVIRWAALAARAGLPVAALGGVDGASARRLPRFCAGAGAIGALLPA